MSSGSSEKLERALSLYKTKITALIIFTLCSRRCFSGAPETEEKLRKIENTPRISGTCTRHVAGFPRRALSRGYRLIRRDLAAANNIAPLNIPNAKRSSRRSGMIS